MFSDFRMPAQQFEVVDQNPGGVNKPAADERLGQCRRLEYLLVPGQAASDGNGHECGG